MKVLDTIYAGRRCSRWGLGEFSARLGKAGRDGSARRARPVVDSRKMCRLRQPVTQREALIQQSWPVPVLPWRELRTGSKAQRGAAMFEVALVLLPMLGLMFLLMDVAFLVYVRNTLQHAVREGVRFAVTSRTLPNMGHDASIRTVVIRESMGLLDQQDAERIQIRYFDPETLEPTTLNLGGNIVEVSIENYPYQPLSVLYRSRSPILITVRASDRMEAQPLGQPPPR